MLKITVVTIFPELVQQTLQMGVVGQGIARGLLALDVISPRAFTIDVHKTVDDRPFGGGDGMLMLAEPLSLLMESLSDSQSELRTIFLSPQGKVLDHPTVIDLSKEKRRIVLLCGRYGGVDQRFLNNYVDEELSLGDFVLSGGELAALAVIDAVGRQIEGVLGHKDSAIHDSFAGAGFLEAPSFTRPREWKGQTVPEVLLSGNHEKIAEWKTILSWLITFKKRPSLFKKLVQKGLSSSLKINKTEKLLMSLNPNDWEAMGISSELVHDFLVLIKSNLHTNHEKE